MNGKVDALAVSGSTLYAAGGFDTVTNNGGVAIAAKRVAQWDGSSWSAIGSGVDNWVYALAVSGNALYAASGSSIAQWNGSSWSALGSGMNGNVNALAVSGKTLYAGGSFTKVGGVAASHIAQWDGSGWSVLGSGMGSPYPASTSVDALAMSGNTLYAGGYFTTAGGIAATNIAQWDGSSWSALGSGMNGYVSALAVSGNTLYAGGYFTKAGGAAANYIAQWNGSSWSALGSGISGVGAGGGPYVSALAVSGATLYVGGTFTTAGTNASAGVAEAILNPGNWSALQVGDPGPTTNTLTYLGLPSSQYVVQYATNLTTSPWFSLATNTPSAYGVGTVQDPAAAGPQRFYRLSGP
jgi:hypothetical protein